MCYDELTPEEEEILEDAKNEIKEGNFKTYTLEEYIKELNGIRQ